MITVIVNNRTSCREIDIDENMTLRAFLTAYVSDCANCLVAINGSSLTYDDLDRTFASFGYDGTPGHDKCFLTRAQKTLSEGDFISHEAYEAYQWGQRDQQETVKLLLDIVERDRKVSFAWKVARTLMLAAAYFGLACNSVPWYMYLGVTCVAFTWGFSEFFADYE